MTRDAFGYDDRRRQLAKQVGVDPYTTNPVLAKQLDDIAWAAFAGGLGVTALKSMVPGSMVIGTSTMLTDWVYDTPPGDLKVRNEKALLAMGVSQEAVDHLLRHPLVHAHAPDSGSCTGSSGSVASPAARTSCPWR